jgi:spore coat protein U-like protein
MESKDKEHFMRVKFKGIIIPLYALALLSNPAHADPTGTINVTATLVTAASFTNSSALNFGTVTTGAGPYTVDTSGNETTSGGVIIAPGNEGSIDITLDSTISSVNLSYTISNTTNSTLTNLTFAYAATNTATISGATGSGVGPYSHTVSFTAGDVLTASVGGTLNTSTISPGAYTNTITITVTAMS